jgi:CHRD domain-containing protein
VKKLVSILTAGAVAALVFAALSSARPAAAHFRLSTTLNAGQEVPKQVVKNQVGHGTFTGTLVGTKLTWKLTWAKLTGPAGAAHIHMAAMGKAGGVVVSLCTPCGNAIGSKSGTATISASLLKTIQNHGAYVNVHTAKNPNGEIRGQLVAKAGM